MQRDIKKNSRASTGIAYAACYSVNLTRSLIKSIPASSEYIQIFINQL